MIRKRQDIVEISRKESVRAIPVAGGGFGPMFLVNYEVARAKYGSNPFQLVHIGDEYDQLIVSAFENTREGLSIDRFLADPKRSKALQRECAAKGLKAPEVAINLRLLALRKRPGGGAFRDTARERWARSNHLVDLYSPGVEAAMIRVQIRFGASLDDVLAHPGLGREFVRTAKSISPGGSTIEYKLCALHIRKSRHLSGRYLTAADRLNPAQLDKRWTVAGTPFEALGAQIPRVAGLAELRTSDTSLFVMRAHKLNEAVESALSPKSVEHLLDQASALSGRYEEPHIRVISRGELPKATLKAWELALISSWRPVFNWPVKQAA